MKKIVFSIFTLVLIFSFSVNAQVKDKSTSKKEVKKETVAAKTSSDKQAASTDNKVFNKVCPVSGEDLENNDHTYTYNGKTYGLCCNKCEAKFKKDPAKYAARLNEDGTKFTKNPKN